jgi:hypothetical protein
LQHAVAQHGDRPTIDLAVGAVATHIVDAFFDGADEEDDKQRRLQKQCAEK